MNFPSMDKGVPGEFLSLNTWKKTLITSNGVEISICIGPDILLPFPICNMSEGSCIFQQENFFCRSSPHHLSLENFFPLFPDLFLRLDAMVLKEGFILSHDLIWLFRALLQLWLSVKISCFLLGKLFWHHAKLRGEGSPEFLGRFILEFHSQEK